MWCLLIIFSMQHHQTRSYFLPAHLIVLLTSAGKIKVKQIVTTEAAEMLVLLYLGCQAQLLNDSLCSVSEQFLSFCMAFLLPS